ncbi:MAG TPA: Fic family protein [Actinocrinis sp.]|nr:Fic family protein [Actinocrinis sp.]
MNDPYALPNGVMRNRLGIEDQAALDAAEADITGARLIALGLIAIPGGYDLAHLRAFHRFIFGDLYDWAGTLRTVDITKHDPFCRRIHLEGYAAQIFHRLAEAKHLRGLDRADFVAGLAMAYADINALHPFREGNGRTQRAFLAQLAREAGYPISWAGLGAVENEAASIAGFRGNLDPLIALLDRHVAQTM